MLLKTFGLRKEVTTKNLLQGEFDLQYGGLKYFKIRGFRQERGGEKIEGVGCDPQKTMP